MTKIEELKAAYAAVPGTLATLGIGQYRSGPHAVINTAELGGPKTDLTKKEMAEFIALAHNAMPMLLEAVERLEAMQRVIGDLASMNPFLRDVFDTNKAVLEKLK